MFPDTPWTQIAIATLHGDEQGRSALDRLCRRYYEPVRRFILWSGYAVTDGEDLTQAFFEHVCEKGILQRADQAKGKFRTFVIAVLKRFLSHANRAEAAQKRGGKVMLVSLEEASEITDGEAEEGELSFDREWALTVMDGALTRVVDEIREARGEEALGTLRLFLSAQQTAPSYETAAAMLGMGLSAVKVEVMRWRRRLGELVRAEVARTVSAPHEIEEELAYLRRALMT
jgi:RNA polymerase sigma-70 factor (ECF subfamily)